MLTNQPPQPPRPRNVPHVKSNQLTNILRDVGEDALRGRIYLPMEDLERCVVKRLALPFVYVRVHVFGDVMVESVGGYTSTCVRRMGTHPPAPRTKPNPTQPPP